MDISNITGNSYGTYGTTSTTNQTLGQEEFLQLFIAQLENQDPLSPMEGQELASQLAEFTSVEQLTSINSNLEESINMNMVLTQSVNNTMATNFIGKEVSSLGDNVYLDSDGTADINFLLSGYAEDVTVSIYDEAGNLVSTIDARGLSSGQQTLDWDGNNEHGGRLPSGNYHFKVEAKNSDGELIEATEISKGLVSSVRYENGASYLIVDGLEVSLADVLEIGIG